MMPCTGCIAELMTQGASSLQISVAVTQLRLAAHDTAADRRHDGGKPAAAAAQPTHTISLDGSVHGVIGSSSPDNSADHAMTSTTSPSGADGSGAVASATAAPAALAWDNAACTATSAGSSAGRGRIVGVLLEPSPEYVVAVLACVVAGWEHLYRKEVLRRRNSFVALWACCWICRGHMVAVLACVTAG